MVGLALFPGPRPIKQVPAAPTSGIPQRKKRAPPAWLQQRGGYERFHTIDPHLAIRAIVEVVSSSNAAGPYAQEQEKHFVSGRIVISRAR